MTDGVEFSQGRQADRGGAPQLDVTAEMSLSYLLGQACQAGLCEMKGRTERRGGRRKEKKVNREERRKRGGAGKIKSKGSSVLERN